MSPQVAVDDVGQVITACGTIAAPWSTASPSSRVVSVPPVFAQVEAALELADMP